MRVSELLEHINYKIGTLDDVSGKAINKIISNRNLIGEINLQMRSYAQITKGIQDVYSFVADSNTTFVEAPPLALRSEPYYYAYVIYNSTIFPIDIRGQRDTLPRFRTTPLRGITSWIMPWHAGNKGYLNFFPINSSTGTTTTLTSQISSSDTTIPVLSTTGYVNNFGRITIDNEKIMYSYKDATNFYGCVRGEEQTTAVSHNDNASVQEHNIYLFYSRLPVKIEVNDDDWIDESVLNRELEIVEDHLEGIIKAVAYNVTLKIDSSRSGAYRVDAEELYQIYARDIKKGYYRGRQGANIRSPYPSQSGMPYGNQFGY